MELDKALGYAVILGWADLKKVSDPCSARAEYRSVAGAAVDYLSIWSVNDDGKQHMVCDYWTKTSPGHASGIVFKNKFQSPPLGRALDFILANQDQFTRPADTCPEGLVLIYPPSEDELAEATAWIATTHGDPANAGHAEVEKVAAV